MLLTQMMRHQRRVSSDSFDATVIARVDFAEDILLSFIEPLSGILLEVLPDP